MNRKLLALLFIGLIVFSTLNFAVGAKVKCPECDGTGKVDCPACDGKGVTDEEEVSECTRCLGTGEVTPNILMNTMTATQANGKTNVTATYTNRESTEISATITASLDGHTVTSKETTFPPDEQVTMELQIDYVGIYTTLTLARSIKLTVNADPITCPECDGQGTITKGTPCSRCDGIGKIECSLCEGTGRVDESLAATNTSSGVDLTLIAGGAGAAVLIAGIGVGSFFLLKKRRVSERSLQRLSTNDFQAWVLKRLDGKPASTKDITMGIDGFSRLNEPITIKQSDSVSITAVDSFAASLAKTRARGGIIVAFGFSDDAIRGKVRARTNYRLDIQMMTVRELIERRPSY
jgi:hypothetical protein